MKRVVMVLLVLSFSLLLMGAEKIELLFWTHEDPNRTEIENKYIEEFEGMYPNVTIKRVTYPSRKIQETVLTAFAAHKGPDIFNMEINDEYPYIVNRRVAPIDSEAVGYDSLQAIYDNYLEGVLDPVTYDGKLYGLPLELTNWCIFINKKYFKEVGLDPTFLVPMVEQLGGALLSEDGKTAIINDEAWLKVLEYFKEWGPNGRNLGSPTYTNARKLFNKDNNSVAMCLTGLYQEGRIRADNPEFYESGEWMVVPFPRFKDAVNDLGSAYYGHYYMVNAESSKEKQYWAWKFIAFMLSHPEEYLLKVGLIQPQKALLESDIFKSIPYSDVFLNDMAKSHIITIHERAPMMQDLLKEAVESVMLTNTTPAFALHRLKTKMNELLEEW